MPPVADLPEGWHRFDLQAIWILSFDLIWPRERDTMTKDLGQRPLQRGNVWTLQRRFAPTEAYSPGPKIFSSSPFLRRQRGWVLSHVQRSNFCGPTIDSWAGKDYKIQCATVQLFWNPNLLLGYLTRRPPVRGLGQTGGRWGGGGWGRRGLTSM